MKRISEELQNKTFNFPILIQLKNLRNPLKMKQLVMIDNETMLIFY